MKHPAQQLADMPPMRDALAWMSSTLGAPPDDTGGFDVVASGEGDIVRFTVSGPLGTASVVFELLSQRVNQ